VLLALIGYLALLDEVPEEAHGFVLGVSWLTLLFAGIVGLLLVFVQLQKAE
jgi:hypothetical protein